MCYRSCIRCKKYHQPSEMNILVGKYFQNQLKIWNQTLKFESRHPETNVSQKPSNVKQVNRIQSIRIEVWKYKLAVCLKYK